MIYVRTIIVVLCIVIFLGIFAFYEITEMNELCELCKGLSEELEYLILCNKDGREVIDKIKNICNTKMKTLYIFANHNSFKDLETAVFNLNYYHNNGEKNKELYYVRRFLNIIDELKEITDFNLCNIL